MKQSLQIVAAFLACLCVAAPPLHAADAPATQPAATQPVTQPAATQPAGIPIAIIDFESNTPADPDLGKEIGDVLSASLTDVPGVRLVDRAEMTKVLQEHALNLSGLVSPAQATKVGDLVGARIIITGRAWSRDNDIFIIAKIIGTETTLYEPVLVTSPKNGNIAALIMQLSQKVAEKLPAAGLKVLPPNEAITDPLPGLKARLAGRRLPTVCVNIPERHLTPVAAVHVDPAVGTEVKNVLIFAGFTVIDAVSDADIDKAGVDVAITGEAFSEFNARIGNLISCSGRVEMKGTLRKQNKVIFSNRTTSRAVDLAENVAGKAALQKGGHELAIQLLRQFDEILPPAAPAATQPTAPPTRPG